jgi:hypothetical protein
MIDKKYISEYTRRSGWVGKSDPIVQAASRSILISLDREVVQNLNNPIDFSKTDEAKAWVKRVQRHVGVLNDMVGAIITSIWQKDYSTMKNWSLGPHLINALNFEAVILGCEILSLSADLYPEHDIETIRSRCLSAVTDFMNTYQQTVAEPLKTLASQPATIENFQGLAIVNFTDTHKSLPADLVKPDQFMKIMVDGTLSYMPSLTLGTAVGDYLGHVLQVLDQLYTGKIAFEETGLKLLTAQLLNSIYYITADRTFTEPFILSVIKMGTYKGMLSNPDPLFNEEEFEKYLDLAIPFHFKINRETVINLTKC